MAYLKTKNIDFIVAPYEADCQIAKLRFLGLVDFGISEDSDLIAFGVNTVMKLDRNGDCSFIDVNKWAPRSVNNTYLKLYLALNYEQKIEAYVLAGTDYGHSVKGIGIKRAVKNVYKLNGMNNFIRKLRLDTLYSARVPENYENKCAETKLIFLFSTVFNPA